MNYYKNERTGEIIAHDPITDEIFALKPLSMGVNTAQFNRDIPITSGQPFAKPNKGKGRPKTDRKCDSCGKKGHTAPTCNRTFSETQPPMIVERDSSFHFGQAGRFDKETFSRVRTAFVANGSSQQTAEDLKLDLAEVNRAVHFRKYGFYIRAPV